MRGPYADCGLHVVWVRSARTSVPNSRKTHRWSPATCESPAYKLAIFRWLFKYWKLQVSAASVRLTQNCRRTRTFAAYNIHDQNRQQEIYNKKPMLSQAKPRDAKFIAFRRGLSWRCAKILSQFTLTLLHSVMNWGESSNEICHLPLNLFILLLHYLAKFAYLIIRLYSSSYPFKSGAKTFINSKYPPEKVTSHKYVDAG